MASEFRFEEERNSEQVPFFRLLLLLLVLVLLLLVLVLMVLSPGLRARRTPA